MMMEVNTASSRANNIMMLEVNAGNSRHNEKRPLEISSPVKEARKHPENNGSNTSVFINQGAIAWNENRRKWVGDQSQRSRARTPEDPVIRSGFTFEFNSNCFQLRNFILFCCKIDTYS
ncbi:peptidase S10, serine carboxypeptidase, alpha/beta hydrolase fold protein [Tanacetum coccineum]